MKSVFLFCALGLSGTVEGVAVRIPLKSLMKEEKSVPIYKRKSAFTSTLFNGRSLRFVEADFFENGSRRAWHVFLLTLISTPGVVPVVSDTDPEIQGVRLEKFPPINRAPAIIGIEVQGVFLR